MGARRGPRPRAGGGTGAGHTGVSLWIKCPMRFPVDACRFEGREAAGRRAATGLALCSLLVLVPGAAPQGARTSDGHQPPGRGPAASARSETRVAHALTVTLEPDAHRLVVTDAIT